MMSSHFFLNIKEGDQVISEQNGLAEVLFTEVREGTKFVTCETVPHGYQSEDETVTFDAIEVELQCPIEWQINTAISSCEARIDNGAEISDAFQWLRKEVKDARNGKFTYDFS